MKPLPAKKVINALERIGFRQVRQKGSHLIMRHEDGRMTVVPIHKSDNIGPGLLLEIVKVAKISKEEFLNLCG